jgi:signal transduction histidine kinase
MNKKDTDYSILIVDDSAKNIQVVAGILKQEGYRMAFDLSGISALEHITSAKFDLILLDIMMPEMDGYEVCKRLKENPETQDIPVIFLTARTDIESMMKGFEIGAADYITKPFHSGELMARVRTHLELKRAREVLKISNEKLQQREQQLSELNATKDKFFSIIAHDLKSPFNGLISGTNYLIDFLDEMEKEQIKYFIQNINTLSKNAFSLLRNLLDWSMSQTGQISCYPEKVSMGGIISDVLTLLEINAKQKHILMVNEIKEHTFVYADVDMITAVIRNLIANALKYTEIGGEVRISSKDAGDFTEFSFSDNGIGIREEDFDKLFQMDVQFSKPGTAGEKGTGLGLILCKEFVERNRGKIWAESKFGKGSSFRFILPKEK